MNFLCRRTAEAFVLSLSCASLAAQETQAKPKQNPEASQPEAGAQNPVQQQVPLAWDQWQGLSLADAQLAEMLEAVQLRLDCDEEALYVRFELPASLLFAEFEEGKPTWQMELSLSDPLAEEGAEAQDLQLSFVDSALAETKLENGVRLLKYPEHDGALRLELNIPRAVAEKEIPWGANGPAIPFDLKASLAILNYGSSTDPEILVLEEPIESQPEEAENAEGDAQENEQNNAQEGQEEPLIFLFGTGFEPDGAIRALSVPAP